MMKKSPENLTKHDVLDKFLGSFDPGLVDIGKDLAKQWGITSPIQQSLAPDEVPLLDMFTVLLLTCNLIEYNPETRQFVRFNRGSNATIAHILFGSKLKTGGSYNTTIQEIKEWIIEAWSEYATTDPKQSKIADNIEMGGDHAK